MNVSIVIASFGEPRWQTLAMHRAHPSALEQYAYEVIAVHEDDGTVCTSRNHAARLASGEWLCFLDADDELAPGYVTAMKAGQPLAPPAWPLYVPAVRYGRNGTRNPRRNVRIPARSDLRETNWLPIGTLIPRELFFEVGGFDERDPHGLEDWSLWTRAYRAGATPILVPEAVYVAHTHGGSSHRRFAKTEAYSREYQRIRREVWPEDFAEAVA